MRGKQTQLCSKSLCPVALFPHTFSEDTSKGSNLSLVVRIRCVSAYTMFAQC